MTEGEVHSPQLMRRALLILISGCLAPTAAGVDSGVDAGLIADAGGSEFCATTTCDFGGTWQVSYHAIDAATLAYCSPPQSPLRLTSDGGSVCLSGAESGWADAGCHLGFRVGRNGFDWDGYEEWDIQELDGGVLVGTWIVRMVFPSCSGSYSIDAAR